VTLTLTPALTPALAVALTLSPTPPLAWLCGWFKGHKGKGAEWVGVSRLGILAVRVDLGVNSVQVVRCTVGVSDSSSAGAHSGSYSVYRVALGVIQDRDSSSSAPFAILTEFTPVHIKMMTECRC
jgi:hypothetical protein